ncbi:MAG: hypothetical protein ACRDOH_24865, partial [Streptosporangiaceae bacterium]
MAPRTARAVTAITLARCVETCYCEHRGQPAGGPPVALDVAGQAEPVAAAQHGLDHGRIGRVVP